MVYFLTGFFSFFFWVTYPALLLIKKNRKKVILSSHGGAAGLFFQKYRLLVNPILKLVDVIITPSGFLRDVFRRELGINTNVIPNICDLNQFGFRERLPIRPKLLVTRSLEQIYNVGCVIRAFKIVHDYFPDSTLGIVGDGSQRGNLENLVSELDLCDCTILFGHVDNKIIQDIYEQYDVFVNASNVDNVPVTILEAFACGLPVVSTNAGGIPYIVEHGVTGLLVEMEDYRALADKVIQLIEDPQLSLRVSRNARQECQNYRWEHVKSLLLPILLKEK